MIVFNTKSECGPSRLKAAFPLVWINQIMTNWYRECPKIFLHITLLMKFPFLPTGALFIKSSFGGSVANASAPRVSMIMLTHRSCTAVRGLFPESTCHDNKRVNVGEYYREMLIVKWYCTGRRKRVSAYRSNRQKKSWQLGQQYLPLAETEQIFECLRKQNVPILPQ